MLQSKRTLMEAALEQPGKEGRVRLSLIVIVPGVVLSAQARALADENHVLPLDYSYRFGEQVTITDDGIACRLAFGGVSEDTFIPWRAVGQLMELSTGACCLWPIDVSVTTETPQPKKSGLRLVREEDPQPS